ncbi:AmmeMemoRadiSam system radical SAM enzyme [Desulfonatronum thioautotrophicum]|uniref:AmmeMemoRadiSam system radical SAM enzyme n=1 Tax=Desulfonatronum thioautotrophicum TaxID=617001 RepID=UPI000A9D2361|nr:AmmeMemoRadiSam system radical SAM enzyme [Desulfonatronum thioautotrophicum]
MHATLEMPHDEARLWKPLRSAKVHCRLCAHFCVIAEGDRGLCGVRINQQGKLYTLVRNTVAALNLDPVEKKPLYHFFPGTKTLSLGTMGCNLSCSFCQNASLSAPPRQGQAVRGERVRAEDVVELALRSQAASISYTYNEPTVFFELVEDVAAKAKEKGLGNIVVSNGFQSRECLESWGPLISAANIDLKAFTEQFYKDVCGGRLQPVLDNLKTIRDLGWWLEVTTLLIPGLNDDPGELRAMADFIFRELGSQTPWHISRFHPDHTMLDRPPTSPQSLKKAWEIGKEAGLVHVYVGNITGVAGEGTECSGCGATLLRRHGFHVQNVGMDKEACQACGVSVAGRGMDALALGETA